MTKDINQMTKAELQAEIEKLKAAKATMLTMKVSQKGAVSVYGMGRFPVTLYKSQWEKLLGSADDIKSFIESNQEKLAEKA